MNVSLIALSIGNTRTKLGVFIEGKLVDSQALPNDEPAALKAALAQAGERLAGLAEMVVVLASVNPALTDRVQKAVHEALPGATLRRAEKDLTIPAGRHLDRETIVGEDRLLNAAAAYDVLRQACIVVDAGTATTIDFVDGAGTFHGGAIGPGGQMMLDALHHYTAQLPEVTLAAPDEPIGHNTAQAMRTAVFHGLRGMVRELVEQYAEVAGAFPTVVATGGNAELLFKDFDLIDRLVPDLTLIGLAVTLQKAEDGDEPV